MAWKEASVPGKGWVQLRAAVARLRAEYVQASAEIRVEVDDPVWKLYAGPNWQIIQEALAEGLLEADITRGAVQRRARLLRRIAVQRSSGEAGWLEFWSETLDVTVLEVYRWDVRSVKPRRR